ncbi:MAG: radical SAM protein [Deltaproteobacteria bacterium]|nr:radical SAM protein [Deltaproteobacteria bacterium]MBW2151969.1 radical SAM protein [Deltaproteobacteria bacterium]
MKRDAPNILLINPWIHDFAAYDFWAKPLGLLTLAAILREHGFNVFYIDCLNRFHVKAPAQDPSVRYGRGPYLKTHIPKPEPLKDIQRNFSRYGIKPAWFREDLCAFPRPDLVLVTSLMTYWYPGVMETIRIVKETYPGVIVVLGGIYASLCKDHAKSHSGADQVVAGQGEAIILKIVETHTGMSASAVFDPNRFDTFPYPAFDLQNKVNYIPILTSKGCPFSCAYCAAHLLSPRPMRRSPGSVLEEIRYWHRKYNVLDFVFYDDALLVEAEKYAIPLFENILKCGLSVRFHLPNAVHIRGITRKIARLMFQVGVRTLRLGLETADSIERETIDRKLTAEEFKRSVSYLIEAGFKKEQVGAYLLVGLPGQKKKTLRDSIKTVLNAGITPVPAYYSPIPHTELWEKAVASSRFDLKSDPIFTNNAILPCQKENFSWEAISYVKRLARGL